MCHEVNITFIATLESDVIASVFPTLTAILESYELCEWNAEGKTYRGILNI